MRLGNALAPGLTGRWAAGFFLRTHRVPAPGWETKLAAEGESRRIGPQLHATFWGGSQGPPVLLVHGWNGRGTQLGQFVGPLREAGFRVVALDGPAHGQSTGTHTNMSAFADALVKVGNELGPLAGYVAHSFGGAAGVLAAHRGMKVKALVPIGAPNNIGAIFETFSREVGLAPASFRAFQKRVEAISGLVVKDAFVGRWAPSGQRGLVLHAEDDAVVPFSEAVNMQAAWPSATLAPLAASRGLGHRKILKDPDAIRQVVDFIQKVNA